eukprot:scaffold19809_cov75-Phaeocystis_antarctica.AAC.3
MGGGTSHMSERPESPPRDAMRTPSREGHSTSSNHPTGTRHPVCSRLGRGRLGQIVLALVGRCMSPCLGARAIVATCIACGSTPHSTKQIHGRHGRCGSILRALPACTVS